MQVYKIESGVLKNIAVLKISENSQENTHGGTIWLGVYLFLIYLCFSLLTNPVHTMMNYKEFYIFKSVSRLTNVN